MDDLPHGERWNRVEALFHATVALPVLERAAFLDRECGDDVSLRQEVEALLALAERAEHFLEPPTVAAVPSAAGHTWVGERVGPYEVTALIGAGGMGEVYRATDTRLGRDVALKVLHHGFSADADRLRRFELESRATAALNHPNILAVFDVGAHDGAPYYVAELLEGETLRDVLRKGRLSLARAVDYAIQIATGLQTAHEKGIVHRDLKPENVFATDDGRIKILDFGVAKLTRPDGMAYATVVGTSGYMSPEQVLGDAVDARTDIFSLGAVLHEMITGSRWYDRGREQEKSTAASPSPDAARVLKIASQCLDKLPDARFASCRELIAALSEVQRREIAPARGSGLRTTLAATAFVLLAVSLAVAAWIAFRPQAPAGFTQIQSVAVLPLASLSNNPDDEIFADGMTGALITNLAKIRALRVVSRTSVMQYRNTKKSVPQIGKELNVDAVVEGSIERVGQRVRISAQLIRTANDQHLWADSYDRDARDVLLLQSEVAQSVAREVRVTLTPDERARVATARTVDPVAYELYLKARVAWNERTEGAIKRAIAYLNEAIARDPSYAAAYSGLADCYLSLGFSFDVGSLPPRDAIPQAKGAALRALSLDDSLAEAYSSLAYAKLNYDWDWQGAEADFRRALALNPGSAEAHHWYSHLLVSSGRLDESLAESDRALALDQLNPIINVHVGWNRFFARQYDQALLPLARTIELDPNFGLAYWYRGLTYEQQRKYPDALREMRKGAALITGNIVVSADIGHVYAAAGDADAAARVIRELQQESAHRYVSPFEIGLIYVGLGDTRRAFEWLEKAYSERSDLLVYLKVDPRLDPIRNDRRFIDLVGRVGIP